jgi:NAD(P)-dependent dehydrogenase (short-subunit alcohol dehydrogenase family)
LIEKVEEKVSLKRLTKPIDVARALTFLCSEESGLMTGSLIYSQKFFPFIRPSLN